MEMDDDELEEQIKAEVGEWASNSNECFTIQLLRGDGSKAASFQPEFTYPIFGEEEAIFGYQDLKINLTFAAHNLRPHLSIDYSKKFNTQGEIKPTDILEPLRDFLPDVAFSIEQKDEKAGQFTPPGEKVHQYLRNGQSYEVWCASLSAPAAKDLLENMQVLMPMFIEGGSILQLEQDWTLQRWKLFLLYQIRPKSDAGPAYSQYSLVGYGTSYRVFTFPDRHNPVQSDLDLFSSSSQSVDSFLPSSGIVPNDSTPTANSVKTPLDLPSRERLSQFLILPPFQKDGHGQELYNSMYTVLTAASNVSEFTVEDPNEAFDDLRDLCDLLFLRSHDPDFAALRIDTTVPPDRLTSHSDIPTDLLIPIATRNAIMQRRKLMERQFDRLVEMHTLSFIPPLHRSRARITRKEKASNPHDKAFYLWRLYVKQRLYIFNRDQLAQVEREERVEKLESALDTVLEGYSKMLERVEKREKSRAEVEVEVEVETNGGAESIVPRVRPSKRKVVDDVEDEDDEEMGNPSEMEVKTNGHKKSRVD